MADQRGASEGLSLEDDIQYWDELEAHLAAGTLQEFWEVYATYLARREPTGDRTRLLREASERTALLLRNYEQ